MIWNCSIGERIGTMDYRFKSTRKKGKVLNKILTNQDKIDVITPKEIIIKDLLIMEPLDRFMNEHKPHYFLDFH